MYIINYIIMLMLIVLFNSCNQPEPINNATGYIPYTQYLDGNIRSFDIINDSLFVASEEYGVVLYRIMEDNGRIYLDSLNSTNVVGNPVTLDIAPKSRSLIVLDDYNHTYIGKLDRISSLSGVTCDDYQRKSTFIDYSDKPIELITPFRHKPTQNEVDTLAWDTSFLHRISFAEATYDFGFYSGDCSDTLYKYINYQIEDVFYNNEKLFLVNPEEDYYSIITLDYDTTSLSFPPLELYGFSDYDPIPESTDTLVNLITVGFDSDQENISFDNVKMFGSAGSFLDSEIEFKLYNDCGYCDIYLVQDECPPQDCEWIDGLCDLPSNENILCIENIDLDVGSLDISMVNQESVSGFDITFSGVNITSFFGGVSEERLFNISLTPKIILDGKPLTVKSNEDYMFVGLDDYQGCYIKLLDSNNDNISNLNIASGYDIQDIQLSSDYIALSSGYGGLLIYKWDEELPTLEFLLSNIYAYKTLMYDDLNMIVGTKNGLHIYEIER